MIKVHLFTFNPFQENTYILSDESGECIIVDPGCFNDEEKERLTSFISNNDLQPVKLINTHCHIDHVLGNKFVCDTYELKPQLHEKDLSLLREVKNYAPVYGFDYEESPEPEVFLKEGEKVTFGSSELEVLFVPGHAPGHIVLFSRAQNFLIGGDVLFKGGIGRTDFPHCDHDALINGIKNKLFPLGDDVEVAPGHGPPTTIGEEKATNPFLS